MAATEEITYIHTDVSGSPMAATDAAGTILWRESYRGYGERWMNQAASAKQTQWFHGKELDATGMQYFGARYYDPEIGRFTSIDPVGFQEGNLHSFNRFAYGNNNPIKYKDPDGNNATLALGGLLGETINLISGDGFNGAMILGALKDGYNGEGSGFLAAAAEDGLSALSFAGVGQLAQGVQTIRTARALKSANEATTAAFHATKMAEAEALLNAGEAAIIARNATLSSNNRYWPAAITAGYSKITGQVAMGQSSKLGFGCAENAVCARLGVSADIVFTKARVPRTGLEKPICPTCQGRYGQTAFPKDAQRAPME